MNMKWSNEDITSFLEVYQNYNVLWDSNSISYRDKGVRDHAMKKLIDELKERGFVVSIDIVRTKIKMIKTIVSQQLAKIKRSKILGTDSSTVYKPKLQWFTSAAFLIDLTPPRRRPTLNTEFFDIDNEQQFDDNIKIEVDEQLMLDTIESGSEPIPTEKLSKNNIPSKIDSQIYSNKKCTTKEELRQPTEPKLPPENKEEDELICFGKYVTAQLRTLPTYNSIRCQQKIHEIIFKEKMDVITQNVQPPPLVALDNNFNPPEASPHHTSCTSDSWQSDH